MSRAEALAVLRVMLPRAWSLATSSLWTAENAARGQCGVTALVAQDMLGGDILRTRVGAARHFYNRVDGQRLDLTEAQFEAPPAYDDVPSDRAEAMADTSPEQYAALRRALAFAATEMVA